MKKYLRITEYVWLTLAILCAGTTAWLFITGDKDSGGFAMLITALAGIMYSMRRRFNRHLERAEKKQKEAEGGKP